MMRVMRLIPSTVNQIPLTVQQSAIVSKYIKQHANLNIHVHACPHLEDLKANQKEKVQITNMLYIRSLLDIGRNQIPK